MNVVIPETKEKVIQEAKSCKEAAVYVDSSTRNGLVGIGAYWQNMQGWGPMSHTIADSSKLTNDAGELATIEAVIAKIWFYTEHSTGCGFYGQYSCFEYVQQWPVFGREYFTTKSSYPCLSTKYKPDTSQWSPARSKIMGNDCAHSLAQQETKKGQLIERNLQEFPFAKSIVLRHSAQLDQEEIISLTLEANTRVVAFTQSVDKASPRYLPYVQSIQRKIEISSKRPMPVGNRDCTS